MPDNKKKSVPSTSLLSRLVTLDLSENARVDFNRASPGVKLPIKSLSLSFCGGGNGFSTLF